MGRVIDRRVVAVECELHSCKQRVAFGPVAAPSTWHDEIDSLARLVAVGWGFVLHPQLRAYCPAHEERVWDCTCRTHPSRKKLCTAHSVAASELVWTMLSTPHEVVQFHNLRQGVIS